MILRDASKRAGELGRRAHGGYLEPRRAFAKPLPSASKTQRAAVAQVPWAVLNSDDGSTLTPGPMVDDTATRSMNDPLAPVGFDF